MESRVISLLTIVRPVRSSILHRPKRCASTLQLRFQTILCRNCQPNHLSHHRRTSLSRQNPSFGAAPCDPRRDHFPIAR
jgi:hypothetical protein